MSVLWFVRKDSEGKLSCVNQPISASEVGEGQVTVFEGPFKEAFQELYRLRAERDGLEVWCTRCGSSEEREMQGAHHSFCRVPEEERKALLKEAA